MTKTAIITGGSSGFGRAAAAGLVHHGWNVVIDGRDERRLTAAVAEIGRGVVAVPGDITDGSHRADLVARAWALGGLDLLVNNAGALGPSPLPSLRSLDLEAFGDLLRVNVVAQLGLMQEALPLLRISEGAIVNITSDAAVEGYEGWGGYGASKAALDQLGRVLAVEEPAVRVWSFDPGDMRTPMHQAAYAGEDISDRPLPASVVPSLLRLVDERLPSGRVRATEVVPA
jgi:NAD(P)-dependent dehydrogenase (short-subunit alcohol dehydrogenase family)